MSTALDVDTKIGTFVAGGTTTLSKYAFVSEDLRNRRPTKIAHGLAAPADEEKPVQFRLNQTGNIFYATTSPELQIETKKLFDSVTVLFAAMTKALSGKNKTLFDYEAWGSVIRKSGFFIEVQKYNKYLQIQSGSLTLNTQIIQQLLPGLVTGSSLEIAKGVLSALNGTFSASSTTETTKLGHILFICEELFGAPSVTVRLFFATKKSHTKITQSPCHKSVTQSVEQLQEGDTFLFVSPDTIAEFAKKFGEAPQEYKNLVDRLSGYISTS